MDVFSGNGHCRDNISCVDEPYMGPVPPGTYDLQYLPGFGFFQLDPGFWSKVFYRLDPFGLFRGDINLHEGGGSQGCITIDRDTSHAKWIELRNLLLLDQRSTITVVP